MTVIGRYRKKTKTFRPRSIQSAFSACPKPVSNETTKTLSSSTTTSPNGSTTPSLQDLRPLRPQLPGRLHGRLVGCEVGYQGWYRRWLPGSLQPRLQFGSHQPSRPARPKGMADKTNSITATG